MTTGNCYYRMMEVTIDSPNMGPDAGPARSFACNRRRKRKTAKFAFSP